MNRELPANAVDAPSAQALQALWLEWTRSLLRTNKMPLSGNVDQWIRSWGEAVGQVGLLNVNIAGSSDPALEKEIAANYSYGRQLGRILEVLAPLVEQGKDLIDAKALKDFRTMAGDIARLKRSSVDDIVAEVKAWCTEPGYQQDLTRLLKQLEALAAAAR